MTTRKAGDSEGPGCISGEPEEKPTAGSTAPSTTEAGSWGPTSGEGPGSNINKEEMFGTAPTPVAGGTSVI